MTDIQRRIIDISYKHKLSHLGSCLTAADIIENIYQLKKPEHPFILSNGHAALALYCVLEKYMGADAEALLKKHGIHPNRDMENNIWSSAGSLGHGLGIAVGYALSDRTRPVFVLTSDAEWDEGSMWEALRVASDNKLENLIIQVNANGFGALHEIDPARLKWKLSAFCENSLPKLAFFETDYSDFPFLAGVDAHYKILTKEEYAAAIQY